MIRLTISILSVVFITSAHAQTEGPQPSGIQFEEAICARICSLDFWNEATEAEASAEIARTTSIDALGRADLTALHLAVMRGTPQQVEQLLLAGADPDGRSAETGQASPLALIDIYIPDNNFLTARPNKTIYNLSTETLTIIPNNLDELYETPETYDAARGIAIAQLLIDAGVTVDLMPDEGSSPLTNALFLENTDFLRVIFDDGRGDILVAKYGADTLSQAIRHLPLAVTELLVEHGADLSVQYPETGNTLLHFAAAAGDPAKVAYLVDAGSDVNAQNDSGRVPLFDAVASGDAATVAYLLSRGAIATHRDQNDDTAVFFASNIREELRVILDHLTAAGTELNHQNAQGLAALHTAVLQRNTDKIRLLIALGAEIDIRDDKGRTPLFVAVSWVLLSEWIHYSDDTYLYRNPAKTIDILIKAGADVNALDNRGVSMLYALSNERPAWRVITPEILIGHGALLIAPDGVSCEYENERPPTVRVRRGAEVVQYELDELALTQPDTTNCQPAVD